MTCFETLSLGTVDGNDFSSEPPWKVTLEICGQPIVFKIDTGADVSVISRKVFDSLKQKPTLQQTNVNLRGPGGIIRHEGEFEACVHRNGKSLNFRCFVVNSNTDNLLSRDATSRLELVKRLDNIFDDDPLYAELNNVPIRCNPVHIQLKEGHSPYSISTARRVPIPLLQKVKELQRLKEAGVIEEIEEATDWCAPMVPVLKKSGTVRICTDFKQLNKAVKRERYMLPTLEDILHKLKGASLQ